MTIQINDYLNEPINPEELIRTYFGYIEKFKIPQFIDIENRKVSGTMSTYVTCPCCGKKRLSHNMHSPMICKDCEQKGWRYCHHCHKYEHIDNLTKIGLKLVCNDCLDKYYAKCEHCGNLHEINELHEIITTEDKQIKVCPTCFSRKFVYCETCGRYEIVGKQKYLTNGDPICEKCLEDEERFKECADCGEYIDTEYSDYEKINGECICINCLEKRAEEYIYDYHEEDIDFDYHRFSTQKDRENNTQNHTFGFELEVSGRRYFAKDFITYFNGEVILMDDSSIKNGGFEIITMPMTKNYFKDTFLEKLKNGLNFLKENDFKGHNYGGLHIHVNESLISATQAAQLINILYGNYTDRQAWLAITQRKSREMDSWARMTDCNKTFSTFANCKQCVSGERHTALNYDDERTYTYEFRIFNSSLRIDRILKNLQCVEALLDYSKLYENEKQPVCNTKGFINYVCENPLKYKYLYDFFIERRIKDLFGSDYSEIEREAA